MRRVRRSFYAQRSTTMASTRIKPFPLHGLVPYRGALYAITHQDVFSQGRVYRIGRYVNERYDERVMINHWDLLENMEKLALFAVGDTVRHQYMGDVIVVKRCWRFSLGAVLYTVRIGNDPLTDGPAWEHALKARR
ncbi:MAG: hypothetical protein JNL43_00235 [Flavobacteriales bacterium]|nr:hypothetical protein [Flavobacteriales bacterium]